MMPVPDTMEVCRADLFTDRQKLEEKYPPVIVQRVMRIRTLYQSIVASPSKKDRELVADLCKQSGIGKSAAYADLAIVKQLVPLMSECSKDFHRWRFNEMILDTYNKAKLRNDQKTMEKAASSYAKYNRIDLEDEKRLPYELIAVQPFTATEDPTVLGIKPIPHLQERIDEMIAKYRKETIDIEDIDFEEVDLEEDELFGNGNDGSNDKEAGLL